MSEKYVRDFKLIHISEAVLCSIKCESNLFSRELNLLKETIRISF